MDRNCPFCGTELMLKRRSIHDSSPAAGIHYYARDEIWKCPNCFYCATFGVPLSKEDYLATLKEWKGHRIEDYAIAMAKDDEDAKRRLRLLGYIVD